MEILEALKTKLAGENITQKDIAQALGVTQATVSRKLKGDVTITFSELKSILELCKDREIRTEKLILKIR